MNRNLEHLTNHNIPGRVQLHIVATCTANMGDGSATANNICVASVGTSYLRAGTTAAPSIERTGEGVLKFHLRDEYVALRGVSVMLDSGDLFGTVTAEAVATVADPYVSITLKSIASSPTATDPDGKKIYLTLTLANSAATLD